MKKEPVWPKGIIFWVKNRVLYASIPFTWKLPILRDSLLQRSFFWDRAVLGGPGVYLMPNYFDDLDFVSIAGSIGGTCPSILQRVNENATKTTWGCIRKCEFCGVPKFEGAFRELPDWPNRPIICDNNLLASSQAHFDRVMDRLETRWGWADFNQGLDARLMSSYHAERFARIRPMIRLSLDSIKYSEAWALAFEKLRRAGIPKCYIRSYALIGFDSAPDEAWERCLWIERHGVKPLPMWFHPLNALAPNQVTESQGNLGWDDYERRKIMQWFYQHKKAVNK